MPGAIFETPQEGTVCFDDHDISVTNLRSLRRCIGTVLQDVKLFAGDTLALDALAHELEQRRLATAAHAQPPQARSSRF